MNPTFENGELVLEFSFKNPCNQGSTDFSREEARPLGEPSLGSQVYVAPASGRRQACMWTPCRLLLNEGSLQQPIIRDHDRYYLVNLHETWQRSSYPPEACCYLPQQQARRSALCVRSSVGDSQNFENSASTVSSKGIEPEKLCNTLACTAACQGRLAFTL